MTVRTRIAPSPTGFLHIGTARTALFNYLFAKRHGGQFILRVEDTDADRSREEFEKDIVDGLSWLGIAWDEGPEIGGVYGPYHQSKRLDIYEPYLRDLFEKRFLYRCFCTKKELEAEREMQVLTKKPPKYSGLCRDLSLEEQKTREKEGRQSTLRFRIDPKKIVITDLVRGELTFDTSTLDDFIVAKDFRIPLYNFVVVIDDYLMKISHVIRGEEHISNIPKQVLICEALGFSVPQFVHLSLILNADRTKLSKRQNKVSLLEYKNEGYLPEAIINFIALLGWNPGGERELFTLAELTELFDFAQVHKSGAIFDIKKLDWFNNHYLRARPLEDIVELAIPDLVAKGLIQPTGDSWYTSRVGERFETQTIEQIVDLERERLKKISELPEHAAFFFVEELSYDQSLLVWKSQTPDQIRQSLQFSHDVLSALLEEDFVSANLEASLKEAIGQRGFQNGAILWPLRVALTGLQASPPPFSIAAILGKEATLKRIAAAISKIV